VLVVDAPRLAAPHREHDVLGEEALVAGDDYGQLVRALRVRAARVNVRLVFIRVYNNLLIGYR
jgi:hypothetical protein